MKAIIVTGSRKWTGSEAIAHRLSTYTRGTLVIHGDAVGADSMSGDQARPLGLIQIPVPYIRSLGKAGGPLRNEVMLSMLLALKRDGYEIAVEAFPMPDSVGTWHMVRIAKAAGVTVNVNRE